MLTFGMYTETETIRELYVKVARASLIYPHAKTWNDLICPESGQVMFSLWANGRRMCETKTVADYKHPRDIRILFRLLGC